MALRSAYADGPFIGPWSIVVKRRDFLCTTAGAAALVAAPLTLSAQKVDPPPRPRLKLSLAAYSFNRQLSRNWPASRSSEGSMTLFDFIDFCGELELDGTELTSYYFPKEVTHDYLMEIKQRTFAQGLNVSGTAIGNDFCLPDGEARDQQLAMTRQWIDYAAEMGAPVIRIFAGKVPKGGDEAKALSQCISGINQSLEYAATKGVVLALENHGGITATPQQLLKIVDGVTTKTWFGVNFDSGNFRTDDPYGDLAKIAPLAVNAQVKVAINPSGAGKKPADLDRIVRILADADYRGHLVLEYEEKTEKPKEEIKRYIDELRNLIA